MPEERIDDSMSGEGRDGAVKYAHLSVLPEETVDFLVSGREPRRIIDGTLGYGGHSSLMLKKCGEAELLGIDRDPDALDGAREF
jgi:16S rRNA (cytosine1402-N4)-methyltransferase